MAPVVKALEAESDWAESRVCVTAQHREMLDQVLKIFDIAPDADLDLMRPDQDLFGLTSRVIEEAGQVVGEMKPDVVLVQGDTTTVMAAALAGFYHRVAIGHVEAGLRTADIYSPFPEEMNRRLTSVLTSFHFAPTERARQSLLAEGVAPETVFVTGNTVIDALHMILERPAPDEARSIISNALGDEQKKRLILVTAHRRENFGAPFESICQGLKRMVDNTPDVAIVYPVHMNPNVREPVFRILGDVPGIHLIDPVAYDVLAHLMQAAYLVITDSGGIQEEAPSIGKPVLVLRRETERPEAVQEGVARVIGPSAEAIVSEAERLLRNAQAYEQMARQGSPYGDGKAAGRIVGVLKRKAQGE